MTTLQDALRRLPRKSETGKRVLKPSDLHAMVGPGMELSVVHLHFGTLDCTQGENTLASLSAVVVSERPEPTP